MRAGHLGANLLAFGRHLRRHIHTTSGTVTEPVRVHYDTFGPMQVPASKLWGAQTQRSLENFIIGDRTSERMPEEFIRALGAIKKAAAQANTEAGLLSKEVGDAIQSAATEVSTGRLSDHFPLIIWQTGSGTQTNMNANEVIAHRALQLLGHDLNHLPAKPMVHPNDHVNLGQSSNDTIPTAMHVSVAQVLIRQLVPALQQLQAGLNQKEKEFLGHVKIGRTHMQDATPLTVGQEFSAWAEQVKQCTARVQQSSHDVLRLAQGGTAVGTGLNTWKGFDERICEILSKDLHLPFTTAHNKFEAIASHDALVHAHGALNTLAVALMKVGNDLRLLASGPRCGLGELRLPANEPGSSIMPGKVNPTQIEMLTMVCCQVMGNHVAVTIAGSQGHLQLNAYKPVIVANVLRSARLLSDAVTSLRLRCVEGVILDPPRIKHLLDQSLMMVTALAPHIGYDKAAAVAKDAYARGVSLREAAADAGVSEEQFNQFVDPTKMLKPYQLEAH